MFIFVDISTIDALIMQAMELSVFKKIEHGLRQVRRFIQREFTKRGIEISAEQWSVIDCVGINPGCSQKEIAETTFRDPASVTRMIDQLEKNDWLVRQKSHDDRRSFSIHLTRQGLDLWNELVVLVEEMQLYSAKGISPKDLTTFFQSLDAIIKNLEE